MISRTLKREPHSAVNPVVIIAALEEEADALNRILRDQGFVEFSVDETPLDCKSYAYFEDGSRERPHCIVVNSHGKGRLDSAITATIACLIFEPSFVFLSGVAGGLRFGKGEHLKLGDVVVSEHIFDLDMAKVISPYDIKVRPNEFSSSREVFRIARNLDFPRWFELIPSKYRDKIEPEVHFGDFISGDAVVSVNSNFLGYGYLSDMFFSRTNRDLPIAVEMEAAGIAQALQKCLDCDRFLVVKGISDFADSNKSSDEKVGRQIARFGSAAYIVAILKSRAFVDYLLQRVSMARCVRIKRVSGFR